MYEYARKDLNVIQYFFKISIKNISSFTSHRKLGLYVNPKLREINKILPRAFIYELTLIQIFMN